MGRRTDAGARMLGTPQLHTLVARFYRPFTPWRDSGTGSPGVMQGERTGEKGTMEAVVWFRMNGKDSSPFTPWPERRSVQAPPPPLVTAKHRQAFSGSREAVLRGLSVTRGPSVASHSWPHSYPQIQGELDPGTCRCYEILADCVTA